MIVYMDSDAILAVLTILNPLEYVADSYPWQCGGSLTVHTSCW